MKTNQTPTSPVAQPATITRNGFLGALTAVLGLPAVAAGPHGPAAAPASPSVVTQADLRELLELDKRFQALAISIRTRLESGANFERGELGVSTCGGGNLEWHLEKRIKEHYGDQSEHFYGLIIEPALEVREDVRFLQRAENQWRKRERGEFAFA
jgi:hypothetical protein